jgi:hypothetical protein
MPKMEFRFHLGAEADKLLFYLPVFVFKFSVIPVVAKTASYEVVNL